MKSAAVALAFSIFGAVSASGCQPNFQGVAMAIISGGAKWGLGPAPINAGSPVLSLPQDRVPDFRFEFSGRPTGSYIARAVNFQGQNLVVTDSGASTLDLSAENVSNTKEYWLLECNVCGSNPFGTSGTFASGCTIKPEDPAAGTCVQLPPAEGEALVLGPCGGGGELFDFWTAT